MHPGWRTAFLARSCALILFIVQRQGMLPLPERHQVRHIYMNVPTPRFFLLVWRIIGHTKATRGRYERSHDKAQSLLSSQRTNCTSSNVPLVR